MKIFTPGLLETFSLEKGKKEEILKKVLSILCLIFLVGVFSYAQESGSLRGTVNDEDGTPLPGVSVTLSGSKVLTQTVITSERGNFRFMGLPVAKDYTLRLEIPGVKSHIILTHNSHIKLPYFSHSLNEVR